jgi:hypothetical protein
MTCMSFIAGGNRVVRSEPSGYTFVLAGMVESAVLLDCEPTC